MENSTRPGYSFRRIFLTSPEAKTAGSAPEGKLDVHLDGVTGEIIYRTYNRNGMILERWLAVQTLEGEEELVGKLQPGKRGQGVYYLKTDKVDLFQKKIQVKVLGRNRFQRRAGKFQLLHYGVSNEKTALEERPGDYLWKTDIKDFPVLLNEMMQKVEALTEKVQVLQKKRALQSRSAAIRRVEPFTPSLPNYKWWQISI
ncbi:hypothetical protein Tfer_2499 [Thermincola ferriacetica]|uniref:Uncharacterized protein n=1 Tax=Thermincola ferriacetica TaxID=281456 RepID=A0A0L6W1D5_9FIRM|nr:hypothetical protein [Thermincola ferriacetica]KNZ68884.1 hypothetical protein Tfer_2499 [Thermincola ferriacetica]